MSAPTGQFAGLDGVIRNYERLLRVFEERERQNIAALFGVAVDEIVLPHEREVMDRWAPTVILRAAASISPEHAENLRRSESMTESMKTSGFGS